MTKSKLAIILLSDQTIPNALFLKDFENSWDKILFVGTNKTKENNIGNAILSVLDNPDYDEIIVDENKTQNINEKLNEYFSKNHFSNILVNITGGTKIMALAAYYYFKNNPPLNSKIKIYYLPIKAAYYIDLDTNENIKQNYEFNLPDYIKATGNIPNISNIENEELKSKIASHLFDLYVYKNNYEIIDKITATLRNYRDKDNKSLRKTIYEQPEYETEIKNPLINQCQISEQDLAKFDFRSEDTVDFFTGGWLEFYTYNELKQIIQEGQIATNVKIKNLSKEESVENELDVAFVFKNELHIIECKTGDVKEILNDVMYKAAQIRSSFGLTAQSHLLILNPSKAISDSQKTRAKLYNIDLIDYETLKALPLKTIFEKKLNKSS